MKAIVKTARGPGLSIREVPVPSAGPGEALLMAMAGRPAALADLTGQGVETLRERLAS